MITKLKIIWSLVATVSGTTAYQAYENRAELIAAARSELPAGMADSLAALEPPPMEAPKLSPEDTAGFSSRISGWLDSARGTLAASNEKSCMGYCDTRAAKCKKIANRDLELIGVCQDEQDLCHVGCKGGDKKVGSSE